MVEGIGRIKAFIKADVPHCVATARQMEVMVEQWTVSHTACSVHRSAVQSIVTTAGEVLKSTSCSCNVPHQRPHIHSDAPWLWLQR